MPETPDFDAMALGIVDRVESHIRPDFNLGAHDEDPVRETVIRRIAEQFRQVWNARGAADIATVDASVYVDAVLARVLDQQLRSLDR